MSNLLPDMSHYNINRRNIDMMNFHYTSLHTWPKVLGPDILLNSHAAGLQSDFKRDEWRVVDHLHGTKMVHTGLTREWQEVGRREKNKGWVAKTKDSTKTELVVDNNLLWRSKAYSFGHFVRDLCGDAAHVQDTGSPFPHQRLLLIAAGDMHLHHSLPIFTHRPEREREGDVILILIQHIIEFLCSIKDILVT